jgi:hypothetical protein
MEKSKIHKTVEDVDDDLPLIKNSKTVMINEPLSDKDIENTSVNKGIYDKLRKLDIWFNSQARKAVEDHKEGREVTLEHADVALFSAEVIKEPMNLMKLGILVTKTIKKFLSSINK